MQRVEGNKYYAELVQNMNSTYRFAVETDIRYRNILNIYNT